MRMWVSHLGRHDNALRTVGWSALPLVSSLSRFDNCQYRTIPRRRRVVNDVIWQWDLSLWLLCRHLQATGSDKPWKDYCVISWITTVLMVTSRLNLHNKMLTTKEWDPIPVGSLHTNMLFVHMCITVQRPRTFIDIRSVSLFIHIAVHIGSPLGHSIQYTVTFVRSPRNVALNRALFRPLPLIRKPVK